MKRHLTFGALVGVALLTFAGCRLAIVPFTPTIGANQQAETTLLGTTNTNLGSGGELANPFYMSAAPAGPLSAATSQRLLFTFLGGVVDVASGAVAGLTVYNLTAPAAATDVYVRGAAVAYTATVLPDGTGGCSVLLVMDLTSASNRIEWVMDSTLLTAGGGTKKLSQDQDQVGGEAGEDDVIGYVTVNGGTPVAGTGVTRLVGPTHVVTIPALPVVIASGAAVAISGWSDASGSAAGLSAASIGGGIALYKIVSGTSTQVTITPTYDGATGILTVTPAAAFVSGELYRFVVDWYTVQESAAVRGALHRGMYNQFSANRYKETLVAVGAWAATSPYQEFGLTFAAGTTATTLATATSYYFKVNGVEYSILTGGTVPDFATVAAAMNTAIAGAGFSAAVVANPTGGTFDIRVTHSAQVGSSATAVTLANGTTGTSLRGALGSPAYDTTQPGNPSVTVALGGGTGALWLDFTLSSGTQIKASSVTPSSVRIKSVTGGGSPVTKWETWSTSVVTGARTVRIYMSSTFAAVSTSDYQLYIFPTLMDDGPDTTVATDDSPFGDPSNSDGSAAILSAAWGGDTW
jgi:hypothetical protein